MSLKELAVEGMTFKFQNPAHGGSISITNTPSLKVKANGSKVFTTPLSISISGGTDGLQITGASGIGTIPATALKVKANGILVMRKDDVSSSITMTGVQPNPTPPPPTIPGIYTTIVIIDNPGQLKVKGE